RPTIAVRWFLVTVVAQLIVGPGMLMADFMAAVMLYSGLVYGTRAQVRRYLVTAAVFDVLVSVVSAARQFVVSYDWTRYGAPTMHQLLWGDHQCLNYTEVDGGTVCSESMAYGGIVSTSLTLAVLITIVLVFAIVSGFWQRARHQTIALLNERNAAIRAREQEEQLIAASAERARIARDMHDVVAHTLSIIIIQSDGGRYAAVHDPSSSPTAAAMPPCTTRSSPVRRCSRSVTSHSARLMT
uniref:histidine kinase dimerization/phosphoacceptor domain-containing protein n=1 Tax=uncultured Bifidobacterium sp. TaxID=165187 RepID=UPI00258DF677